VNSHRAAQTHRHPMRVVTRRTGLSAELLRVWERRYRVVTPARTQTGRRLYSDSEIERLHLLYRATLGGRSIGLIASLSTPALVELLRQDTDAELARTGNAQPARTNADNAIPVARFLTESLQAVEKFDPRALHAALHRASIALPVTVFLENVVASILEQVGTRWRDGSIPPVHARLTTTTVRRVLESMIVSVPAPAPRLLMASLTGDVHELGALMAAVAAASEGWSVTWLGANLTAEDIAEAAAKLRVRAVGLSLVYPVGDVAVSKELRRLRSLLPRSVAVVAGGAASSGYAEALDEIGATRISDLNALVARLRDIATKARAGRASRAAKR